MKKSLFNALSFFVIITMSSCYANKPSLEVNSSETKTQKDLGAPATEEGVGIPGKSDVQTVKQEKALDNRKSGGGGV